jgi:hypothetical protein
VSSVTKPFSLNTLPPNRKPEKITAQTFMLMQTWFGLWTMQSCYGIISCTKTQKNSKMALYILMYSKNESKRPSDTIPMFMVHLFKKYRSNENFKIIDVFLMTWIECVSNFNQFEKDFAPSSHNFKYTFYLCH